MKSQANNKKGKVFVGLSGGVDSAVSAALLKKEGYEVSGVFIKAWTPEGYPCTWREDRRSAMRVAAVLDIPFFTLDLEKEYKEGVVDYMIREYRKGRTPNPDVMCNKEIKFGAFLKWALEKGVDYVATGHYARVLPLLNKERSDDSPGEVLCEAKDKNKDQSYFLWTLTPEHLKHVLFPVGGLLKPEVRRLATKFKLPQATRKDSQGLCFLGQVDMKEFLSRYIEPKKGEVLNLAGEIIGEHNGAFLFTVGERHGFTILTKTPEDEPLYVVSKNIEKNTITVAPKITTRNKELQGLPLQLLRVELEDQNWLIDPNKINLGRLECRFRYRQEKVSCVIENNRVIFRNPQSGISSGQSLVLYRGEEVVGGGIIM